MKKLTATTLKLPNPKTERLENSTDASKLTNHSWQRFLSLAGNDNNFLESDFNLNKLRLFL